MSDFGNEEYKQMVCVEAGNVAQNKNHRRSKQICVFESDFKHLTNELKLPGALTLMIERLASQRQAFPLSNQHPVLYRGSHHGLPGSGSG